MKLSVALCTYNGEQFIEQQLHSILGQTIPVDEIIVCDDQSSDNTISIIKKLQEEHKCIVLIENDINLRSTKNFEKAIALTTGDYIFLSDQDDVWKTDKIAKTLAVFNQNPTAEVVFSNADIIDENNECFTTKTIWDSVFFFEKELTKPIDFFDIIAKNGNVVTGATLCMKKEIKSIIIPFPTENLHDEWIASIAAFRSTLFYSTENLISYRIHKHQQVGMKRLDATKKTTHKKRIILGLQPPKKFSDYQILQKKIFLKQKELLHFDQYKFEFIDLDKLSRQYQNEFDEIRKELKIKFPIRYVITSIIDTILGKRRL
jgi:glycosyltransferase involved in cell wall biosynthesis